jgi:TrmH family RNA methyltransferase
MPITRTELKNLRALQTKKGRREHMRFLAEGTRLLEEAARFGMWPKILYFAPAMISERATALIERFREARVTCQEIQNRQMEQIADTKTSQGLIGVFETPATDTEQLYHPKYRTILVCENIADPGNLGTLLRSALAFNFRMALLLGRTAEPYAPKTVRASAGAVFGLALAEAGVDDVARLIKESAFTLLAAAVRGEMSAARALVDQPAERRMVAVGSEADGLSEALLGMASVRVRIDHSSDVDSLNAAIAGSILMKEVYDFSR